MTQSKKKAIPSIYMVYSNTNCGNSKLSNYESYYSTGIHNFYKRPETKVGAPLCMCIKKCRYPFFHHTKLYDYTTLYLILNIYI